MRRLALSLALLAAPHAWGLSLTDSFGYHLTDPAYVFDDISGSGTQITAGDWVGGSDDGYYQLSLPFNFRFYGAPYNKVSINTNGYLQFGSNSAFSGHDCLTGNITPNNIVAGFWTDLNPGAGSAVQTLIQGLAGSRTVTIQYSGVPVQAGGMVIFQFVLYEASNDMDVRYNLTSLAGMGSNAAAGLRGLFDCPNHASLPFSCNLPLLTDNLRLYYAYPVPESGCGTPTVSPTFSASPTHSPTLTISPTFSVSPTHSPTPSDSPSPTASPSATPTATPSPSPTVTPTATATRTVVALTDVFGYAAQSAPFSWVDISGLVSPISAWAGGADDGSNIFVFPAGMLFKFYGTAYDKVAVASNGYLQFGTSSSDFGNNCLSASSPPSNIIALFWQDLDPGLGGSVYVGVFGAVGSRMVVVQYEAVREHAGPGSVSAEAILFEGDNHISLRYKDTAALASGAGAVSGLRSLFDCPNRTSLPLSCSQPQLGSLSQVDIAYPSPEPGCGTHTVSPTYSLTTTFSQTSTISPTFSDTSTVTPSFSATETFSASPTFSVSPTISPSFTTSDTFTVSPTISETATISETFSVTETHSPSPTLSPTLTLSPTFSDSPTESPTFSITETGTPTSSVSPSLTISETHSFSPTLTATESATPTATLSATETRTPSATPTATRTDSPTRTITSTTTPTPTWTATPTATSSPFPPAPKPACAVLGEPDFTSTAGLGLSAAGLSQTSGVALDTTSYPYRLYVSDRAHHRILIYSNAGAISAGGPADGVIGQADLVSGAANRGGGVAANALNTPLGLDVDLSTGDLWVADSGNHRVLRFSYPVPLSGAAASRVLGQAGLFNSGSANLGGLSASSLQGPADLSIDSSQRMVVADSGNHRVLRFDLSSPGDTALYQWGQANFGSALPNRGGSTSQSSLLSPAGVLITASDLWVSDSGNHRVLRFGLTFITPTASQVLGQPDYVSGNSNQGFGGPGPNSLSSPLGLGIDSSLRLFVADFGNHRVLAFDPPYPGSASLVYGQSGMFSGAFAAGNDRMNGPTGLKALLSGNLLVADSRNHRLLFYGCAGGVGASTATPSITQTSTQTSTRTMTPSVTETPTISATHSPTLTATPTPTFSDSPTRSATLTISATLTATPSVSATLTLTPSRTLTLTLTVTHTPYVPPSATPYPRLTDKAVSYPNPARLAYGGACLAFPPGNRVEILILDMLLQEVRRFDASGLPASRGVHCWNLRNNAGDLIAPGIYYIRVVVDGKAYFSKMTVI